VLNHRWVSERATYMTPDGYLMAWDDIQGRYRPAHVLVLEQIERLGTPVPGLTAYRATGQTRADRGEELETLATPELLDAVCGGHHWEKFHEGLSRLEPATVCARAAYLYGCLGNNWRSYPSLLGCDSEVLQVKFEELDRRYGRRWRKQPSLLGRNLGTLATNAAYLDEIFGDRRWLGIPLLLTMDPQTLRPRAAALDARFGRRRWIEQPQLLAREPSTLSRNAALLDKRFGAFPWCGQVALVGRNPETLRATADYLDLLFPDRPWQGRPQLLKQKPETLQAKADLYARLTKNAPLSPRALTLSAATMARRARELAAQVGRRRAARWLHESPYLLDDPRACARRVARELPSAA